MSSRGSALWCLLLQLLFLRLLPLVTAIRKDIGFRGNQICRTTVHGRYLLSDDNGHVCDALSIDPRSRCCPMKGKRFSCHGCNPFSRCCNSYEYCVSCCLNPSRTRQDEVVKLRIAKTATAGTYGSVFDFCAARCRHNSGSVVHENAYISEFHHCFAMPSNRSGEGNDAQLESRLVGVNVVVGGQGESCDSVCRSKGQSCIGNKLMVLNDCDIVRRYMSCKGGCLASIGSDQPAEVVVDAPKDLNPGTCLYTKVQSMLSCDGSHRHTQRLCPCA
ncbi:SREBP regulating gene protein [Linum perenne]